MYKKIYFNRSIYNIAFLYIVLIFIKFSTTAAFANSFKISDIEISKPYDLNFKKEEVIEIAFEKAFQELIFKLTTLNSNKVAKIIKPNTAKGLIESFSIVNEQFIDKKYIAKFNVEFNKREVFKFLEKNNIFPSIPVKKNLFIMPILIETNKDEILMYRENAFFENWNKNIKKYHLLTYVLPNEDIEDFNILKRNLNKIEEYNFDEIRTKYALDDFIILIIFKNNNEIKTLSKIFLNKNKVILNKKFEYNNEIKNDEVENIIKTLKLDFENQWKKINLINTSIKLQISLSVDTNDYKLIQKLENNLSNLDFVSSFNIDNYSNERTIYKVKYNSSPNRFIDQLKKNNFNVEASNNIWMIK